MKLKAIKTICVNIPPSPLLGGTLLAIAEGLIENEEISVCLRLAGKPQKEFTYSVQDMALQIKGVLGVNLSINGEVVRTLGQIFDHAHTYPIELIDSPEKLIKIASAESIREVIQWKPSDVENALEKFSSSDAKKMIIVHANLHSKSRILPLGAIRLSYGRSRSWSKAILKFIERNSDARVLIIGDDGRHFRSLRSKGILIAANLKLPLHEQLSLVATSLGFVGMSSGPSTVALLSSTPYVIFKHPKHHQNQMLKQLGDLNHYSFANSKQRYIRQYPSAKQILRALEDLFRGRS
jgi:hypothetical protein